jgi:transposase
VAVAAEKKLMTAAERSNRKRAWFWGKMKRVAHGRLKFIDEAGVRTTLMRRFGRAAPGERVVEAVPKNYGHSTSIVSVIRISGVETTMVIAGALDTLVFDAFCEAGLCPCLQSGDIVVLDNLGAHRASRIEETARGCEAKVIWLPPYLPDFSPIEPMWSKLKTYLRKVKARTSEELEWVVGAGL